MRSRRRCPSPIGRPAGGGSASRSACGILLLGAGLTLSCSDVRINAVDVARVEIQVQSNSLTVGDSALLSARLLDAAGHVLSGRLISWSSATPAVADVDAVGRVRALTPGSAAITATSEGVRDEIVILIEARPVLITEPASVLISAVADGPPPSATPVTVRANGTANGLTAVTAYAPGQPTGWLTAGLTGSSTPAMLTLAVSSEGLAPGTYDATITIRAQNAESERILPLTLVLQPKPPAIGLSTASAAFDAIQGGSDPPPQTVAVANAGGGSLAGLRLAIAYTASQPGGWLNARLDGTTAPATLILEPSTGGLGAGSYSATVLVSSDAADNSPQAVEVTFEVDAPPPVIVLSPTTMILNGTAGGPGPATTTVTISNGGGGQLDGLHTTVSYATGEPTGWLTTSLSSSAAPAFLTLDASTSTLSAGSYSAVIEVGVADTSIAPATLAVTLNANAPIRTPVIGASPSVVSFSASEGGADPADAVIAITNAGGGTLDGLALGIRYDPGQPTGWLDVTQGGNTAPTSITAHASTGALAAGTYGATIEVSSPVASNSPLAIAVTFTVAGPPAIAVSANAVTFSDALGGSNPPPQTVDVTNGGGGTLDGLAVSVKYVSGKSGWLNAALSGQTAPASIDLQPMTGSLSAGTYTARVDVASPAASNSPVSIDVAFTVGTPPAIALGTSSLAFQGTAGGSNPPSQNVSIANSGGGTLSGLVAAVRYNAGQPTGWLNAALSGTTAPATLTVQPVIGTLPTGTYGASIDIASFTASNSPQTIAVSFTIAALQPPTAPVLISASERHHHADLVWQDNSSNETSFVVQRQLASTTTWSDIVTLKANTTSYHDDTGIRGLLYNYRIAACNAAGCSISNVLSVLM